MFNMENMNFRIFGRCTILGIMAQKKWKQHS